MNRVNKESLDLIKSFEGLENKAYKDAVGVWTIGYGHTAMAGPPTPKAGMVITNAEAEELLLKDLKKYEAPVIRLVKVPINDNQYGALVSFTYNLGEGNFSKSTLLKKVNAKDFVGAAKEFAKWDKAGGKVLKGLTRRRAAEAALFLKTSVTAPVDPVHVVVDDPGILEPETPEAPVAPSVSFLEAIVNIFKMIFGGKNGN